MGDGKYFLKGIIQKMLHFVTKLAYIYDTMPYKLFFYNVEKVLGYFYECYVIQYK